MSDKMGLTHTQEINAWRQFSQALLALILADDEGLLKCSIKSLTLGHVRQRAIRRWGMNEGLKWPHFAAYRTATSQYPCCMRISRCFYCIVCVSAFTFVLFTVLVPAPLESCITMGYYFVVYKWMPDVFKRKIWAKVEFKCWETQNLAWTLHVVNNKRSIYE